jgi:hypothetical protein
MNGYLNTDQKTSKAHCLSCLHYTYRYSSDILSTTLQAGHPWGCGSTFAGTTEILTRQNSDCLWGPNCHLHNAHRGRWGGYSSEEREWNWTLILIGEVKNEWSCNSIPPHTSMQFTDTKYNFLYIRSNCGKVNQIWTGQYPTHFIPLIIH